MNGGEFMWEAIAKSHTQEYVQQLLSNKAHVNNLVCMLFFFIFCSVCADGLFVFLLLLCQHRLLSCFPSNAQSCCVRGFVAACPQQCHNTDLRLMSFILRLMLLLMHYKLTTHVQRFIAQSQNATEFWHLLSNSQNSSSSFSQSIIYKMTHKR